MENKNTLWSKLSAPQLREAIEMFRSEQDSDNEHLSFDEYQSVVNVVALADWIEWEYSEILMVRQEQEYIWEQEVKESNEYIRNGGQYMASTIAKLSQELEIMKEEHKEEKEWLRQRIHLLRSDFSRLSDLYYDRVKKIEEEVSVMREYLTSKRDFKTWVLKGMFD